LDRDGAIRDLLALIERNEWEEIAEYRVAAGLIESLAAAPVAPDVADALERLAEALVCLRRQPAAHYSLIFMHRNPINGQAYDGSFSPEGLISVDEKNALAALANEVAVDGMKVAEIGSFTGRGSTRVFAAAVRPRGGSVVCVDRFADDGVADLRDLFEQSTTALGFRNLLKVIEGNSREIAAWFPDGYFDLIYIDAGHSYDDANSDIRAWRSKVRPGGILCGHDCIRTANEFTVEQMQSMMQDDAVPRSIADPRDSNRNVWAHPGVIAAVAANFGTDVQVMAGPCGIWGHRATS
jgi:predicted O-methyltransferase YrrM